MTASFVFIRAEKTVLTFLLQPSDSTVNCFCPFYPSLFCMCIFHQFDITLYIIYVFLPSFTKFNITVFCFLYYCYILDFLVDNNVFIIVNLLQWLFSLYFLILAVYLPFTSSTYQKRPHLIKAAKVRNLANMFIHYCKRQVHTELP